jgi:hypothetical protein
MPECEDTGWMSGYMPNKKSECQNKCQDPYHDWDNTK